MEQQTIQIQMEILLQLLELANRLVTLNYTSRTETNFVKSFAKSLYDLSVQNEEQNNKIDGTQEIE